MPGREQMLRTHLRMPGDRELTSHAHLTFRQDLLFGFLETHTPRSRPPVCCSLNHRTRARPAFLSAPKLLAVPVLLVQTPLGSTRSRLRASVFPSAGCGVTLTPTGPSCPGLHLQATVALWPLGPPRPQALLENGLPHHGEPMTSTQQSLAAPLQGRARAGGPGVSPGSLPSGWPVSTGLETPTPRGARRGSLLLPFVWLRCRPLL